MLSICQGLLTWSLCIEFRAQALRWEKFVFPFLLSFNWNLACPSIMSVRALVSLPDGPSDPLLMARPMQAPLALHPGGSGWPAGHRRSDGTSLLRSGSKRPWHLPRALALFLHHWLWGQPAACLEDMRQRPEETIPGPARSSHVSELGSGFSSLQAMQVQPATQLQPRGASSRNTQNPSLDFHPWETEGNDVCYF